MFFVKFTQILFIIYPSFLKNFIKDFQNFPEVFSNIPAIYFFFYLKKYYSKLILFSNFRCIFSTVPQSFIDILLSLLQISQMFFQRFTQNLGKVTVKIFPNFYSGSLENFLTSFRSTTR